MALDPHHRGLNFCAHGSPPHGGNESIIVTVAATNVVVSAAIIVVLFLRLPITHTAPANQNVTNNNPRAKPEEWPLDEAHNKKHT